MARSLLALVAIALGIGFQLPANAVVTSITQPSWAELAPEQKEVLAPLSGEWDQLEPWRRKKWLGIAKRYPVMNPEEQARIQRRMIDWVKLSPDDRKAAREKYKHLQMAPAEHKEAIKQKWQEYKRLPDEEKLRLKDEAAKAKPLPKPGRTAKPAEPQAPEASASTPPAPAAPPPQQ